MSHNDDHWFRDKHGNRIKRLQLVNKILDCIGDKKKCCKQISNEIGFDYQIVRNILRRLLTANILDSTRTKVYTYYHKVEKSCLLQDMFYNKKEILKKMKIKSVKKYTVEDFKNKKFERKKGIVYNQSSISTWEVE